MPPTGLHGLLGLFIASKIKPDHKYSRLGVVWGSVMPDLDLIGSVLIFIFTGGNIEVPIAFHRSITHSLILIALIFIIAFIGRYMALDKQKIYFPFILGLSSGMFFHVILDMFYFSGVTLFWPLQPITEKIIIIPF
ncbi:MAG: metal-dependent hydrolase, partial [Candidatus Hodarchaeales archaeon]